MNTNQYKEILDYIENKDLIEKLKKLKDQNKSFSDVVTKDETTEEELQYINLVQEGGGTLGISLVGFCFVLEFMGIRFLRLAGTSAGAINTLFMAALGKDKREAITPRLFNIIKELDMFSFVDGHWMAKWMIKSFIAKDNWFKSFLVAYVIILSLLIFYFPFISKYSDVAYGFYGIFFILFLAITGLIVFLYIRFKKAKFGINPGRVFHNFLIDELKKVGVYTKSDLDKKAKFEIKNNGQSDNLDFSFFIKSIDDKEVIDENIQLKDEVEKKLSIEYTFESDKHSQESKKSNHKNKEEKEDIIVDYTFITVDIAFESKVEFPKRADLYWENVDEVNPADFVRASMSIPIFFEPFFKKIEKTKVMIDRWSTFFIKEKDIPSQGIFIDGGSISNFPMNIFHNPKVETPRLPVIGIRINDAPYNSNKEINSFKDYATQIVGTMKSSYDKDFLLQNLFYEKFCIADINTYETNANWLDFKMSDSNKKALFEKGVESAIDFLEKFNWKEYKKNRIELYTRNKNEKNI